MLDLSIDVAAEGAHEVRLRELLDDLDLVGVVVRGLSLKADAAFVACATVWNATGLVYWSSFAPAGQVDWLR